MSFEVRTGTTNIGSRDWLEASASKNLELRAYLPPIDTMGIIVESLEPSAQFTLTGDAIPALMPSDHEGALLISVGVSEVGGEDQEFLTQLKEYHARRFSDEW